MIKEKHSNQQLPNELSTVFSELQVSKYLRKAGIRKSFGFTVWNTVYLTEAT
ncbi:hypothetical protein SAMN05444672_13311 [Bacillus sp. OK838]|nr:hypothetical protein SAMN05444672_13311 [Bacillus sp. OK838]